MTSNNAKILTVAKSSSHTFHKPVIDQITLLTGLGVEGDAHMGITVKHRSRVAADPTQPNLRQIHLIQSELFHELLEKGFTVKAGDMGENVTTHGIDLLGLPRGTLLHIGDDAIVEVTGLRNPCAQIDKFQQGLLKAVLDRDADGGLVRKAGIMGIIIKGGVVKPDDEVRAVLPPEPHHKLERV